MLSGTTPNSPIGVAPEGTGDGPMGNGAHGRVQHDGISDGRRRTVHVEYQ
jgi:hypothetical protein